jgi:hypothetical protein
MTQRTAIFIGMTFLFAWGAPAQGHADAKLMKIYREVYPDLKPNCTYCHIDKLPKKEDGQHELNPYGKTIQEKMPGKAKDLSDEDLKKAAVKIFQEIGRHDQNPDTTAKEK